MYFGGNRQKGGGGGAYVCASWWWWASFAYLAVLGEQLAGVEGYVGLGVIQAVRALGSCFGSHDDGDDDCFVELVELEGFVGKMDE